MMEPVVVIYCLQRDKLLIEELVGPCQEEFARLTEAQLGKRISVVLSVCDKHFLVQRDLPDFSSADIAALTEEHQVQNLLASHEDDKVCFGGVVLKDETGKIICKNTLDLRTEMVFNQTLPQIRKLLFAS